MCVKPAAWVRSTWMKPSGCDLAVSVDASVATSVIKLRTVGAPSGAPESTAAAADAMLWLCLDIEHLLRDEFEIHVAAREAIE